jgi:soluble lytic murein transglycosylase-like protein
MTHLNNYVIKLYSVGGYVLAFAVLIALFQAPVFRTSSAPTIPLTVASVQAGVVKSGADISNIPIANVFFGPEASTAKTEATIQQKIAFVSSRKAYPASLAVIQKHEEIIRREANKKGVPQEVAIGIGLLENGGSDTAKSPAGALGVFQLMPGTARALGLTVNGKIDERRNPEKNIEAGMRYLAQNYERFGDWGLSTWAYHAGEGNVAKALKIYAKANHNVNLPGVQNAAALRNYVEKYGVTIHKLLSDANVKQFTKRLNDDSSGYPYKVVATAALFEQAR